MRRIALAFFATALASPALADTYPVAGSFGASTWTEKGPIDCDGRRVVTFWDHQRWDTGGGVPEFRNYSVTRIGIGHFAIVDQFNNLLIHYARTAYELQIVDDDRIALGFASGGFLKLQRCD
jgi:hypothetical protein